MEGKKIYCRSVWKTNLAKVYFWVFLLSIPFSVIVLKESFGFKQFGFFLFIILIFILLLIVLAVTQLFYVILTPEKLGVKNLIFPRWGVDFDINDIQLVIIGNTGGLTPDYIQILTRTEKTKRYVIDLIGRKEYPNLVKELREKGIDVELKGIDPDAV